MPITNTQLPLELATDYTSLSQRPRVLTQRWVASEGFCPSCGRRLTQYGENRPVADFFCVRCGEDFELKSKSGRFSECVADGAYAPKIERLKCDRNPNLLLLSYHPQELSVVDFAVVPKHFFTIDMIEKRAALAATARRAGWMGSNIHLASVPQAAWVYFVRGGTIVPDRQVKQRWSSTLFLRDARRPETKGWLLDIMRCLDKLHKQEFTLDDVYSFELDLACRHPENSHVRPKIRQQLQVLRDQGYLKFISPGKYRLIEQR